MMSNREIQSALIRAGFSVGASGADGKMGKDTEKAVRAFQKAHALLVDGDPGQMTQNALQAYTDVARQPPVSTTTSSRVVDPAWMPNATMKRVICHWTAGAHKATLFDRKHYHILIQDDGSLIRGVPSIVLNDAHGAKAGYAAHTLNCNTGSIGVSLCCMAGAIESPFKAGSAPMTKAQWEKLAHVVADLCHRYSIPVSPQTVLSHAEVSKNLKIPQRGKWDFTRLAFDPSIVGSKACGDRLRAMVSALL